MYVYTTRVNLEPPQLFHLLADETRLRCVLLCNVEGELCVCELVHALGLIQPKVSRHLGTLRDAGVLVDRRAGQWIYYRVNPGLPAWARNVIAAAAAAAPARKLVSRDRAALGTMANRPDARQCA